MLRIESLRYLPVRTKPLSFHPDTPRIIPHGQMNTNSGMLYYTTVLLQRKANNSVTITFKTEE